MSRAIRTLVDAEGFRDDVNVVVGGGYLELANHRDRELIFLSPSQTLELRDFLVESLGSPTSDPSPQVVGHPMAKGTLNLSGIDEEVA